MSRRLRRGSAATSRSAEGSGGNSTNGIGVVPFAPVTISLIGFSPFVPCARSAQCQGTILPPTLLDTEARRDISPQRGERERPSQPVRTACARQLIRKRVPSSRLGSVLLDTALLLLLLAPLVNDWQEQWILLLCRFESSRLTNRIGLHREDCRPDGPHFRATPVEWLRGHSYCSDNTFLRLAGRGSH